VLAFADDVRASADEERDALGFLPGGVYAEAARRGKLLVATIGHTYAGHLLFGGTFPRARVFQIFVKKEYRKPQFYAKLCPDSPTLRYLTRIHSRSK